MPILLRKSEVVAGLRRRRDRSVADGDALQSLGERGLGPILQSGDGEAAAQRNLHGIEHESQDDCGAEHAGHDDGRQRRHRDPSRTFQSRP